MYGRRIETVWDLLQPSCGAFLLAGAILMPLAGCNRHEYKDELLRICQEVDSPPDRGPVLAREIEKTLGPPIQVSESNGKVERRVYRKNGEKDALVVSVRLDSGWVMAAAIVTPDASGEIPEGIWSLYTKIKNGERLSTRYIEQRCGPPIEVTEESDHSERRIYRAKGDPRYLDVWIDRRTQKATDAFVAVPYHMG